MMNLATTLVEHDQQEEAEELRVQVMKISKKALDPEHGFTLMSMMNLASTYQDHAR